MSTATTGEVRRRRLRAQHLAPRHPETATVADVVRAACGLQAQEKPAAALSVRARRRGLTAAAVERALYEERSVVRTWCMRGTLHLVATEDLPLYRSVFGPTFATRGPEPRRLAEWGLDEATAETAVDLVEAVLADEGPLTRDGIAERLVAAGVDLDPSTQAPNFLIRRAALRGVLCEVAPIEGKNAYDRPDAWVDLDSAPEYDVALATLARRYLAAYGPATRADFAAWSGLYATDVTAAWDSLGDDVREVGVGETSALVPDDRDAPDDRGDTESVRLLPGYDTFLLGYAKSNRPIPDGKESRVWPGGGIIRPTVLVDGQVAGTWHLDRSCSPALVTVSPFASLDDSVRDRLDDDVRDVGRFLDRPVEWRVAVEE